MEPQDEQQMKDLIVKTIKDYNKSGSFSDRKPTDTPTDSLQTANRRYVDRKALQMVVFSPAVSVGAGTGKAYAHIDQRLGNLQLADVHALVITAGTTNTTNIQVRNVTNSTNMLSTVLTVDSAETGSNTAATPAVINALNARVLLNDVIRIDVDSVSTTPPKGLIVTLGFTS